MIQRSEVTMLECRAMTSSMTNSSAGTCPHLWLLSKGSSWAWFNDSKGNAGYKRDGCRHSIGPGPEALVDHVEEMESEEVAMEERACY